MQQPHHNRRVLVTGAGSGIGHAIARQFVEAGARVHIADVDPARIDEWRASFSGMSGTAADTSSPAGVDQLFDDVMRELGGLDILINNVGISGPTGPIEAIEPDDWDRTLAVNIGSHYLCCRRAVPLLKAAGGGSIICISSTAGQFGYPLRSPYAVSKWGIIGLVKTLAMELGAFNIRVNAVCPGSVSGPRMDRVIAAESIASGHSEEAIRDGYTKQVSLNTFVSADDIANTVLFVCSDFGNKVSGQALAVDGHTETMRSA